MCYRIRNTSDYEWQVDPGILDSVTIAPRTNIDVFVSPGQVVYADNIAENAPDEISGSYRLIAIAFGDETVTSSPDQKPTKS